MKSAKLFFPLLIIFAILSFKKAPVAPVKRPKLVVGIVVDQMRWDFL